MVLGFPTDILSDPCFSASRTILDPQKPGWYTRSPYILHHDIHKIAARLYQAPLRSALEEGNGICSSQERAE